MVRGRVLVTGAAGGIGHAVARAIASRGHECVGWDIVEPRKPVGGVVYDRVDIADHTSLRDGVARLSASSAPIHGLVHCAGIAQYSRITDTAEDDWRHVLDVNLTATVALCQQLVAGISDQGRVVLFGSGTIFKGPPELFAYVAAKAGVRGLVRSLAREVGQRGVTVNMISPGFTNTQMVQDYRETEAANIASRAVQRRAEPDDLVGPVMFFLSDDSRFVTGQNLMVDGGSVMY